MSSLNLSPVNVTFRRLGTSPLEDRVYFTTLADAQTYAASATALVGQELKVVTANPLDPIQTYEIQRDKTLKLREAGSGDGSIEELIVSATDIGGIRAGDVIHVGTSLTEIWQRLLSPDTYPSITSFTASPTAFGLKEIGQAISTITLTANVVKGTNDISTAKIIRLPNTNSPLITNSNANGGTVTITDPVGIDTGIREYRCQVEDVKGLTAIVDMKFEFVWSAYTGSVSVPNPTAPTIQAMTKHIVKPQNVTHSYTHTGQYMAGAFPTTWGMPTAIRDNNGIDYLDYFTTSTVTLVAGSYAQAYNVFVFSMANTFTNYDLTFHF